MAREISRQAFLRGAAGALAAGAVFGPGRATAAPNPSGWDGLSTAIGGKVVLPRHPQFAGAKQVFNTNYNGSTPAAIVTPTSAADVQKAMAFAAAHNLKVAPRSGGHSYIGASTANGAMVLRPASVARGHQLRRGHRAGHRDASDQSVRDTPGPGRGRPGHPDGYLPVGRRRGARPGRRAGRRSRGTRACSVTS